MTTKRIKIAVACTSEGDWNVVAGELEGTGRCLTNA